MHTHTHWYKIFRIHIQLLRNEDQLQKIMLLLSDGKEMGILNREDTLAKFTGNETKSL